MVDQTIHFDDVTVSFVVNWIANVMRPCDEPFASMFVKDVTLANGHCTVRIESPNDDSSNFDGFGSPLDPNTYRAIKRFIFGQVIDVAPLMTGGYSTWPQKRNNQ